MRRNLLQPVREIVTDINNEWNKTVLFKISYYNKRKRKQALI